MGLMKRCWRKMWTFIKNNLFMIKRSGLLYNMKPRNTFFLTLILGATGIPRLLNKNFISGGLLLFVFILTSDWDNDVLIWIGVFDAVTSIFYREPEPKKKSVEDKHKVTRAAVTNGNQNSNPAEPQRRNADVIQKRNTEVVQKKDMKVSPKRNIKIGNKICHFCGAPMPSNETVCSYCRMEETTQ